MMRYIHQASKELEEALKRLHYQWRQACEGWNDPVQKQFDNNYMQGYDPQVRSVTRQITALANLIAQAEREIP